MYCMRCLLQFDKDLSLSSDCNDAESEKTEEEEEDEDESSGWPPSSCDLEVQIWTE